MLLCEKSQLQLPRIAQQAAWCEYLSTQGASWGATEAWTRCAGHLKYLQSQGMLLRP